MEFSQKVIWGGIKYVWLFCTVGFNEIGMQTFFYQTEMMTSGMALNLFKNLKMLGPCPSGQAFGSF